MKKLLIILASLGVVAAILFFVFRKKHQPAVDKEIAKRLIELVHDGSKGLYRLQMDSLVADVVDSKLTIYNARLTPDTVVYETQLRSGQAPPDLFTVTLAQFSIDDISPVDFLTAKEINLEKIFLKNPDIHVIHRIQKPESAKTDSLETIYKRIGEKVNSIKIDTIRIEDASFTYENRVSRKINRIEKVGFLASNFQLNQDTQTDTSRFLFARNCLIRIQNYKLNTPDSLYTLSVGDLQIETLKRALVLEKLKFLPRVSTAAFYKQIGRQQDRFTLAIDKVTVNRIGWWKMLADESLQATHMVLDKADLDVYNDKQQKPDSRSKVGKYPHHLLMKLAIPLRADTIEINNMRLAYNEVGAKTGEKGTLQFTGINGKILNLTNDSAIIRTNPLMKINLTATFMQEAPLQAGFVFNLQKQRTGDFEVSMKLGKLSKEAINKLSVPLGPAKLEGLDMKSLNCSIKGNNNSASGTVTFEYANLKVAVLKNDDDKLKKKKLLSFIANTFILKDANPAKGNPARVVYPTFKRDPKKSYFNLVWKTIFTGIKMTAGINK